MGQPWALPAARAWAGESVEAGLRARWRGRTAVYFSCSKGRGGGGAGTGELTLLVLTLAQDPGREGAKDRRGARGLPAALLGRPAKANAAGQFLERDVGVSEVGKELARLNS